MKQTKENMGRLGLRIVHLQPVRQYDFNGLLFQTHLPAELASIELLKGSPLSIGDSVVGVALIWTPRRP